MLSDRQKKIMVAIVEAYTENNTSEPIGSSTLTKMEGLDFSSATLRNEMAALEEMGYLDKTHTSSGRVPTEKGYRLYVDELMNIDTMMDDVENQVLTYVEDSKLPRKEAVINLLKTVIDSADFNYGAIVLEKTAFNARIAKIDFVETKNHNGIFIMVTDTGLVLSKEVAIPEGFNCKNVEKTVEYLNEQVKGMLLNDFKLLKVKQSGFDEFYDFISNAGSILELVLRNFKRLVDDKKQVIGQFNILHHADFADINLAQKYLESLKNGSIYQLIEFDNGPLPAIPSASSNCITVKIGHENGQDVFNNCSSITAYYQSKNGTGAITVYGPMRMKYRYVIALLEGIVESIK